MRNVCAAADDGRASSSPSVLLLSSSSRCNNWGDSSYKLSRRRRWNLIFTSLLFVWSLLSISEAFESSARHQYYHKLHRRHRASIRFSLAAASTTSNTNTNIAESSSLPTNTSPHAQARDAAEDDCTTATTTAFGILAELVAETIACSDAKRDTGYDGASTGWTSWVDQASAAKLQACIDRLRLLLVVSAATSTTDITTNRHINNNDSSNDESRQWLRWIRSCPAPMLLELTPQLREAVRQTRQYAASANDGSKHDTTDDTINATSIIIRPADDFLQRIGMRFICLPSGSTLASPLRTAPGAMVFGTLLLGGVTRFRLIGTSSSSSSSSKRRAGERTVILPAAAAAANQAKQRQTSSAGPLGGTGGPSTTTPGDEPSLSWLQYGGPERNYQAIDMGPCLVLELLLLPTGLEVSLLNETAGDSSDMVLTDIPLELQDFLYLQEESSSTVNETTSEQTLSLQTDDVSVCDLESNFCAAVGGLQPQINEIVRRVLDGRVVRPASSSMALPEDRTTSQDELDRIRREEMKSLLELGLQPVRGLLLYGPPGCGKTHLAREISTILDARPPKIVAAPELLDRWVGGTERMVRELFADAEYELNVMCGGDATKSALHVIVVDEIDSVFRRRSAADSVSEVTRASAVNQILSKLDGIETLGNVLFVAMTNRRELIDPALLRPGRLEVQVEIPLPNREGRREILKIHFGALRNRGRLSRPLCNAIDGTPIGGSSSDNRFRRLKSLIPKSRMMPSSIHDLAADHWTGGFSGADLAGLVRNAGSIALARSRNQGDGGIESLLVTLEDVARALVEVKQ